MADMTQVRLEGDRRRSEIPGAASQEDAVPVGIDGVFGGLLFPAADRRGLFPGSLQDQGVGAGQRRHPVRAVRVRRCVGLALSTRGAPTPIRCRWPPTSSRTSRRSWEAANELRVASRTRWPALARAARGRHAGAGAGRRRRQCRWLTFLVFGAIIAMTMFVTYLAAKRVKTAADFYAAGGGVSGPAERLGDRRRLPVGGVVPGDRRPDLALWLRRLHVLGGLAGRLHHRAAGDCRALPQHRQVHAGRHPRLPQRPARRRGSSARSRRSRCRRST